MNAKRIEKYKIEKGVPIPDKGVGEGYPFAKMEIGDSFTVPSEEFGKARSYATQYSGRQKGTGVKFTFKAEEKDAKGKAVTHRCWRIA